MGQYTRELFSEEDINDGDSDDSIGRAVVDQSINSIQDRNVTKVSSTRKLHDQGGEGFLMPSVPLKDAESFRRERNHYSRNETFAANSSRAFDQSNQSKRTINNSSFNESHADDYRSDTFMRSAGQASMTSF